jgi:hypothetical protein
MKIAEFLALVPLLFVVEGFSSSITSNVRHPTCIELHREERDDTRRTYLNQAVMAGFALVAGAQSTFAAGSTTNMDTGMATTKNKKLGGLALKIRSVGVIMVGEHCFCSPFKLMHTA